MIQSTKIIIVNATALDASGALTILRQFVEKISQDEFEWIVFVSDKIEISVNQSNIRIVPIGGVKSFVKRFLWDAFGVKQWLKKNNIKPFASLSLQNTNFRTGYTIPNYIYYHQSIPFFNQQWSLFKKEQRIFWFYKHIYPFFIKLFLNNQTEIFVQVKFIKQGFAKRFHFPKNKIHIITPTLQLHRKENCKIAGLPSDKINLFYPATPLFYKNHQIIVNAVKQLKNSIFEAYFTCKKEDFPQLKNANIHYMGTLKYEEVLGMYYSADALIFPSYIETYGLPLLEAASTGLPILVSDLPYAREVLEGYEGATFIDHTNATAWATEISKLKKGIRHKPIEQKNKLSWEKLFEIVKSKNK